MHLQDGFLLGRGPPEGPSEMSAHQLGQRGGGGPGPAPLWAESLASRLVCVQGASNRLLLGTCQTRVSHFAQSPLGAKTQLFDSGKMLLN